MVTLKCLEIVSEVAKQLLQCVLVSATNGYPLATQWNKANNASKYKYKKWAGKMSDQRLSTIEVLSVNENDKRRFEI